MKIAVNTRLLLKNRLEGIGRVTYEIVRRLVAEHPDDEFIFCFDRPYDKDFIFGKNVTPLVIFPPSRHPILWYLWFEHSLPRALKKYQPDVFYSPDGYNSLKLNCPTVMVTHDLAHIHYPNEVPFLVRKFYQSYVPKYLKKSDQVISVSNATKEDIIKQYQISSEKISVVHNGNREGFFKLEKEQKKATRIKYSQGCKYFFYLGAVHPRKNLERLILAFDLFKQKTNSDVKLLIGGRLAWQTDEVRSIFEQSVHKKDIRFLGFIPEEDLPKLMGAALAMVYVSLFEGFGLPILEAMYAEVPVITSNVSAMPEVAGDAALLVDPLSVSEIVLVMEKIFEKKSLRKKLVKAGKIQREKFSWDNAADQTYAALEKVVFKK
jgi:Glycosyltransferase